MDLVGASNIVHYGFVHNPGTMNQREDRLHRYGQTKHVFVYRPFLKNTIDEGIMNVFLGRMQMIQDFMDGSDKMAMVKLSIDDYRRMIEGKNIGTEKAA